MLRLFGLACLFALAACASAVEHSSREIRHPDRPTATVEYFVEQPKGNGPWPTIILLHGHQNFPKNVGGRAFADWGVLQRFANEGYLAVSVSLPGYGNSTGPRDFAGPYSQNAVVAVMDHLKKEKRSIPDRIVIHGTSLGAVTAALIGTRDKDIAGLVLISGLYDLPSFFEQNGSTAALDVKAAAVAQTGGSQDALRSRSALLVADQIKANTLILNGALDERTDAEQARMLAAAITAAGGKARAHIFPEAGHDIPLADREAFIAAFLRQTLGGQAKANRGGASLKADL
jgi:dipeptidyl aminopeptidase/acylaminoacyl peptidase